MNDLGFVERQNCPGCGANNSKCLLNTTFDDSRLSGFVENYYHVDPKTLAAPYRLEQCVACSLIFQRFVGNEKLMSRLYEVWAPTAAWANDIECFTENMAAPKASRDAHELMTLATFLGRPVHDLRVLDYGMGWGLWPAIARKLGADAYGTELSPKMIKEAILNGVKIVHEPIYERFDFINLDQVIEHLPQPRELLLTLSHALNPGGIIKLSLPNAWNACSIISKIASGRYRGDYDTIMPIQPLEHINSFTRRAVKIMTENAGLHTVKPSVRHRYEFVRSGGIPRDTRSIAKELIRPFWQYHNRRNIYVWLRRAEST